MTRELIITSTHALERNFPSGGLSWNTARLIFAAVVVGSLGLGALGTLTACDQAVGSVCTPGLQVACDCLGGSGGIQVCNAEGTGYGECVCAVCSPNETQPCTCTDNSTSQQTCSADGYSWGACECPDIAVDDDSPLTDPPTGMGGGDTCGTLVGEYRGVGSYSNGNTYSVHGAGDLATCQGDFPVTLDFGHPSADGCGGIDALRTPNGLAYQCVEYARRFYASRYNVNLKCSGNAVHFWTNADSRFDLKMQNGDTTTLPQPDDLIIFRLSAADTIGHIAVVRRVTVDKVYIIQQNWAHSSADESYQLSLSVDGQGKVTVAKIGNYSVLGWLRSTQLDAFDCSLDQKCPDDYQCDGTRCVTQNCGNGLIDAPEECDGDALAGQSCASLGLGVGTLTCRADCTFNRDACGDVCQDECQSGQTRCLNASTRQTCGNYDADACLEWGGDVSCSCANNQCSNCGNGAIDAGEQCDGGNLNGATCISQGHDAGTLTCSISCTFNTSGCCDDQCASQGATQCLNATTRQTCGNYDADACLEWGSNYTCPNGGTCSGTDCEAAPVCYTVDNSDPDFHTGCASGNDWFWTLSGASVSDAENNQCLYTYTNGATQDCFAIWAFPSIPTGNYSIYVRIPTANSVPEPVAPASVTYNIYAAGGATKAFSNPVDQNFDQGTWKMIKFNVPITANADPDQPVRITLGDGWFTLQQYVLLLDAVRLCEE